MTTHTRIDHAAEAMKAAEQTLSYGSYGEDAGAIVSILAAQTHATLALVEQQRLANLLAFHDLATLQERDGRGGLDAAGHERVDRAADLIQEGLGL